MPAGGLLTGPCVGVGAVVIREDRVLLIRRGKEPLRGRWVLPGGTVELGESLADAVVREIHEETGIRVAAREIVTVFDRIQRDEGRVVHHHVIVDFVCEYLSGVVKASSDAEAAAWVSREELAAYDLPEKALEVVLEGFRRATMLK
jgi:mutator protein MutT